MVRASKITDSNKPITRTLYNPLINDYVSQTEIGYTQTIPLVQEASYIIMKSGSYYYGLNGSTNKVDYGGSVNAGGVDGTDAAAVIQATLNALATGGKIFFKKGVYEIISNVSLPTASKWNQIIIDGEGASLSKHDQTGTGSVLLFNGSRFSDGGDTFLYKLIIKNVGLYFYGDYSDYDDAPFNLKYSWLQMENCELEIDGKIHSNDPFFMLSYGGGTSSTHYFRDVTFIDQRTGGHDSIFAYFWTENLIMDGCVYIMGNNLPDDRFYMFHLYSAMCTEIRSFAVFIEPTPLGVYGAQFFGEGTWILNSVEFLDPSYIQYGHLYASSGNVNVTLINPRLQECGPIIVPSVYEPTFTVDTRFIGHGFENSGTATLLNGQTTIKVAHGLVAVPTRILITLTADPKSKFYWISSYDSDADGTKFTISASADPTANVTFDWKAIV